MKQLWALESTSGAGQLSKRWCLLKADVLHNTLELCWFLYFAWDPSFSIAVFRFWGWVAFLLFGFLFAEGGWLNAVILGKFCGFFFLLSALHWIAIVFFRRFAKTKLAECLLTLMVRFWLCFDASPHWLSRMTSAPSAGSCLMGRPAALWLLSCVLGCHP